jgi:hypothetical protein
MRVGQVSGWPVEPAEAAARLPDGGPLSEGRLT